MFPFRLTAAALGLGVALGALAGLVGGCKESRPTASTTPRKVERPSLRIFALGGAAGAIEPCGCVQDMLGGVDHAAALIRRGRSEAQATLVLGAGPMFFQDPVASEQAEAQAKLKAEAMAGSLHDLGLTAWAPGANDWALGAPTFRSLAALAAALPLAANLGPESGVTTGTQLISVGGLKVGLLGVSVPRSALRPSEFLIADAQAAFSVAAKSLLDQGAQLTVGLLAAPRGDALRLVEGGRLQLAILGKSEDRGEANDEPFEPMLIGSTLVVQAQNHLQGLAVVDVFVRGQDFQLSDGSGLATVQEKTSLERRALELARRIEGWQAARSGVSSGELAERKAELAGLQARQRTLGVASPPQQGSYFLYDLVLVREKLGTDEPVAARLLAYYRRVNEHNREVFKDKAPQPLAPGESGFLGVDQCTTCHQDERAFWDTTQHAKAYATLEAGHKEFNLDCVSCHVTGYEKPGGSTVTHVAGLTSVQCENCHGPGSRHAANPADLSLIRRAPARELCSECHHPPHVHSDWNVEEAWSHIVGAGHGR